MVELDLPQTILEGAACVLLSDEELYRFRVVKLGKRIQTQARSLTAKTTLELLVSGVTTWSPVVGV